MTRIHHRRKHHHTPSTRALKMSAKNVHGPNGKKPASAATNLIGKSVSIFISDPIQKHVLMENNSWRGSRYDGSTRMPPTWYICPIEAYAIHQILTMTTRYHQSTNATFPPSASTGSEEAGIPNHRCGDCQERDSPGPIQRIGRRGYGNCTEDGNSLFELRGLQKTACEQGDRGGDRTGYIFGLVVLNSLFHRGQNICQFRISPRYSKRQRSILTCNCSWSGSGCHGSRRRCNANGSHQNPSPSPTSQHGRSARHSQIPKRSTRALHRLERRGARSSIPWCISDCFTAGSVLPHKQNKPKLLIESTGSNQAVNFTAYTEFKELLQKWQPQYAESPIPSYQTTFIGLVSGAMGPLSNAPIDTIKTRLQKTPAQPGETAMSRITAIARDMFKYVERNAG